MMPWIAAQLPDFNCHIEDLGDGCIWLLATRGKTDLLFNVHVDTVPANPQWQRDPWTLTVEGDKVYGLGSCDIKGAAAALISASKIAPDKPMAILFSSDEEAGSSVCIHDFVKRDHPYKRVVVSEPTLCKAVTAHRGVASTHVVFNGHPGHASSARALTDSAVHHACQWVSSAVQFAGQQKEKTFRNLQGVPLNVGRIEGGIKPNMIAGECELKFGIRTLPGQPPQQVLDQLHQLSSTDYISKWNTGFYGPSLPADQLDMNIVQSEQLAADLGMEVGPAVDFWTEASLFSEAGLPALVYGPGSIEQAHIADEWVLLEQLETACKQYVQIINGL